MHRVTVLLGLLLLFAGSCKDQGKYSPDILKDELINSRGNQFKAEYEELLRELEARVEADAATADELLSMAETRVVLFIFGLSSREVTIPRAKTELARARELDSTSCKFHTVDGMLKFLDWEWYETGAAFREAIRTDPTDPLPRHWYSLYLSTMTGDYGEPMAQSDTIMTLDASGDFKIGRGSLLYFARRNTELRDLMLETIAEDPSIPWGYDWLGMAYCELGEWESSIDTYLTAFELSDGLVEVGGGLGHALGLAGETTPAKYLADKYASAAESYYLPPVQRAFIHIGLGEYDEALSLLERAYMEKSWFLIFMNIEPWYDPIREEPRFQAIVSQMSYPTDLSKVYGD